MKLRFDTVHLKKQMKILSGCILILLAIFMFSNTVMAASTNKISYKDSNIKYIGRWEKSDVGTSMNSFWGGSYFTVNFTGTTVKIMLEKSASFVVQIDNGVYTYYNFQKAGTINLTPKHLTKGTHSLRVIAKYESDELKFKGLLLDKGCKTKAVKGKKIIEFIGDSITAGYHAGAKGVMESTSDYAWLTGETLGYDHTQIAFSGIRLTTGYGNSTNTALGMEDAYFKLKPINYATSADVNYSADWDFSKYKAEAVVINLGTNDAWAKPSVPSDVFTSKYTDFLAKIRAKYPSAQIFVMKTFGDYYTTETQAAVNARVSAGDTKLHFIDTTDWLVKGDFFDGAHPNAAGHLKITEKLTSILKTYLK